jgi:hypothetical protein
VLWFNIQNDQGLGDFVIGDRFIITQKMSECGSNVPTKDSYSYTEIPEDVFNFLKNNNGGATINNLLSLANDVLAGKTISRELSPAKIDAAVPHAASIDAGNDDEYGNNSQASVREFTDVDLKVYPNPFSTIVKFELNVVFDTHVRLEIYSHNGSYLGVICDEDLKQGDARIVEFDASKYPHTTFLYKLTTPYSTKSGTIMRTRTK